MIIVGVSIAAYAVHWRTNTEYEFIELSKIVSSGDIDQVEKAIKYLDREDYLKLKSSLDGSLIYSAIVNHEHQQVIKLFDRLDIDVNEQNYYGQTPLHYAVGNNNAIAVEFLISRGANPLIASVGNETPVEICEHALKREPDLEACVLLLSLVPENAT